MSNHNAISGGLATYTEGRIAARLSRAKSSWYAWCVWVASSVLGVWLGLESTSKILDRLVPPLPRGGFAGLGAILVGISLALVAIPAVVGMLQGIAVWLLFRQRRIVIEWCCACVLPATAFAIILWIFGPSLWLFVLGIGFSASICAGQGYVLGQNLGYAVYWAFDCTVTLIVSGFVLMIEDTVSSLVIAIVAWGLIYGMVTAAILVVFIGAEKS